VLLQQADQGASSKLLKGVGTMQQYSTTRKSSGFAIPEDDKRSLLAEDQYRLEITAFESLTIAQEAKLVDLARAGDMDAQTAIIEHTLGYIYFLAWRYAKKFLGQNAMDIAQAGNVAIVEHLHDALQSRLPFPFLKVVARNAMINHCTEDRIIPVPRRSYERGRRAPLVISITTPILGTDLTILDLLEDANWSAVSACVGVQA
jgi:DNA-directed RNA polymerase specialized sigma24 family protein